MDNINDDELVKVIRRNRAEFIRSLTGMTELCACNLIVASAGFTYRIRDVGGKPDYSPADVNVNRVNLQIVSGVVESAYFG